MRQTIVLRAILGFGSILAIALFLVHASFFAVAQEPRIGYGDTVEGELTDENTTDRWFFEGTAADIVTVSIARTSDELAPVVVLTDPKNSLLMQFEWPDQDLEAAHFTVSLRTSGPHELVVDRGDATTGGYTLTLELDTAGNETASIHNTIAYGQVVTGEITNTDFREFWQFSGSQNDIIDVTITALSGDLKPSLELVSPQGDTLTIASAEANARDTTLRLASLPTTGVYTIVASRSGAEEGTTEGIYDLSLTLQQSGETDGDISFDQLTLGAHTRIRLTSEVPIITYQVEARGVLSIGLNSAIPLQFVTVNVKTIDGIILKTFSGISPFRFSTAVQDINDVLVEISSPINTGELPVDLALNIDRLEASDRSSRALLWNISQRISDTSLSEQEAWHFAARADDLVQIELAPFESTLGSVFEVIAPDGSTLVRRAMYDQIIQPLLLKEDGLYEIFIYATTGYEISVQRIGVSGLAFGQKKIPVIQGTLEADEVSGELAPGASHAWILDITEGQQWRFDLSQTNALFPIVLTVEAPGGEDIGTIVAERPLGQSSLDVMLAQRGRYHVIVFDPTRDTSTTYTLKGKPVSGGPLAANNPAKGIMVSSETSHQWTLDAPPDALLNVHVDLLAGEAGPDLYVAAPDGSLITSTYDNKHAIDNGALAGILLLEGGQYGIVAESHDIESTTAYHITADITSIFNHQGDFFPLSTPVPEAFAVDPSNGSEKTVRVTASEQIAPQFSPDSTFWTSAHPIEPATLARGEIRDGNPYQAWTFSANTGQMVGISATALANNLQPSIILANQEGFPLAGNFKSSNNTNYLTYRFNTAGTYYIVIDLKGNGRYTLWLDTLTGIDETVPDVWNGRVITYGTTSQGEIVSPEESQLFAFYGYADDTISVQMAALQHELLPVVKLMTLTGEVLEERRGDDTGVAGFSSLILPKTGIYQLIATFEEGSTGHFALHLGLEDSTLSPRSGGQLVSQQVAGLTSTNSTHHWLFNAQSGERITLWAEPSTPPPLPFSLQLADSSGQVFLEKRFDLTQSTLQFTDILLPRTGIYQAIVTGGRTQDGSYRIGLERSRHYINDANGIVQYGQTVGKVLTPENFLDVWTFAGSNADVVTVLVRVIRGDHVPLNVQLRSHNGQVLGTAVGDPSNFGTYLENVALPSDGFYTLIVGNENTAFEGETAYELTILLENTHAPSMGTSIAYGQQAEGIFYTNDRVDTWLFDGNQGDVINVSMASGDASAILLISLLSTDWHIAATTQRTEVLTHVQSPEGEPAQLENFTLPSDGTYALRLESPTVSVPNRYQLALFSQNNVWPDSQSVIIGRQYEGQISDSHLVDTWSFRGDRNDRITINVTPQSQSTLAPVATLQTLDGVIIARSRAASKTATHIETFALPTSADYVITVGRQMGTQGRTSGRYLLEVQSEPADQPEIQLIDYDRLISSGLDENVPVEHWLIEGRQGDVIRVFAETTSGNLDPVLRLYDLDGNLLAVGDDEEGLNPEIIYALPADARYQIEVARFNSGRGTTQGNYGLFVEQWYRFEPVSAERLLVYGDRVVGNVANETPSDEWVFAGTQGDIITVQLQFPLDDSPLSLYLKDPAKNTLIAGARERDISNIETFLLPVDGFYLLEVRRPGDARAQYTPYTLNLGLIEAAQATVKEGGFLIPTQPAAARFYLTSSLHTWSFQGRSGETAALLFNRLSGPLILQVMLLDPGGSPLFSTQIKADDFGTFATTPFNLPVDGLYTVLITGRDVGSTYRLTLQTVESAQDPAQTLVSDGYGFIHDLVPMLPWRFEAEEGEVIFLKVAALSGDLEPDLMLWGPDNRPLREGIQHYTPDGLQADLINFVAPQSGQYTVNVTRTGGTAGNSAGQYRLMLRKHAVSSRAAVAVDVATGSRTVSTIPGSDQQFYAFRGLRGDSIAIAVHPLDGTEEMPALSIEAEDGKPFEGDAQILPGEVSIPNFILPDDGRYVIIIESKSTLTYELVVFQRDANTFLEGSARNLGRDQAFVDGILDSAQPSRWVFPANANEVLSFVIDTTGGSLRADLTLYGPDGYIASATEQPGSKLTTLGPVRLVEDGSYLLVVSSWLGEWGTSTGRFSVRILPADPGVSGSEGGYISARNMRVTGGLTAQDPQDIWTFDGQAGEILDVRIDLLRDGASLDFEVLGPDGVSLFTEHQENPEAGITNIITPVLPTTGSYSLVISATDENAWPVNYRMAIFLAQSPVITSIETATGIVYGKPQTAQLTEEGAHQAWVFYGHAGSRIKAEVMPIDDNLIPVLYLVGPDGQILFVDQTVNAGRSALLPGFTLKQDGFYGLVVSGTSLAFPSEYIISLEFLAAGAEPQGVLMDMSNGVLTSSNPVHQWTLTPAYSGRYLIKTGRQSPGEMPELFIFSGDGTLLDQETSAQNEVALYLEQNQQYEVLVSAGVAVSTSQYTIELLPAAVVTGGGTLDIGKPNIGRINDSHAVDEWIIPDLIRGTLTIKAERISGSLKPSILLYDENGILLREVGANENGLTDVVIDLPSEGFYRIQVTRSQSNSFGDYTIVVTTQN